VKIAKDILTDYDNETYDTGRVLAVLVVLSMTGMQAWAVYKGGTFDAGAYGAGVAAVIGALGIAIFGDNAKRDVAAKGLGTANKANEASEAKEAAKDAEDK
jgi:hypothetical protein